MNRIAEEALERARRKVARAPAIRKPVQRRVNPGGEITAPSVVGEPVTAGPYSHQLFLEGRRNAVDVIKSMQAMLETPGGPQEIIENLTRAAVGKPPSYAAGVCSIIDLIKGALV